jgi:hypothetical protein
VQTDVFFLRISDPVYSVKCVIPKSIQNTIHVNIDYGYFIISDSPLEESPSEYQHRVFFLRSRLPARLFGILVGAERVSAQTVVLDILSEAQKNSTIEPARRNLTAGRYTPINVSQDLTESYLKRTSVEKESLCWALLLTIAFMDLIIHQNPRSLKTVSGGKL